jgi:phosphatidyl-myo-inositol dimannoside synthase
VRVFSITSSYPRFEGDPTAPFIESITESLAEAGHTMHMLLPANREWARPATEGRIHFHPYRYSPVESWTPWGYSESLAGGVRIKRPLYALAPLVVAGALRASRRVMADERFDLVHAHWVIPNGPLGALIGRRGRLPLVLSLHGSDMAVSERSRPIGRAARWCFERAASVTAPSEDLLDRARRLGARGILEHVPYGVDADSFAADPSAGERARARLGLAPDETVVVAVGRFVRVKGFEYLIDAYARARADAPNLRLVLVGDGDIREELEGRARMSPDGGDIVFTGMVPPSDVAASLAAADIVAVPSVRHAGFVDGLPNVALEAMAAGKPLVATSVGGLPQLVHAGETGLLVEEKDSEALAGALVTLAGDPALRARMGEAARSVVRDSLTWTALAERLTSVYERVVR